MNKPFGIKLLVILAILVGVLMLAIGIAIAAMGIDAGQLFGQSLASASLVGGYGVIRLITAYGLSRLRRRGRVLEFLACALWLLGYATMIGYTAWRNQQYMIDDELMALALLTPGALLAIIEIFYLRRAPIAALFAQQPPAERSEPRGKRTLVIVSAVAALLVALLVAFFFPNLREAVGRSGSKRAMADMRTLSTALEAYAVDHQAYPRVATVEELVPILTPKYAKELPLRDPWNSPYRYGVSSDLQSYRIACAGKGGKWERELWSYPTPSNPRGSDGETLELEDDIVFENGSFIRYPQGRT